MGAGTRTATGGRRAPEPVQRRVRSAVAGARTAGAAVTAGDRPYLAAFAVLLVVGTLMLAGPIVRYLDGRDRVELLERQRDALAAEIQRLESREHDLTRAEHVELLAREQLGLVRPGEIPYIVVTPEPDRPQVTDAVAAASEPEPWYRRMWRSLAGLVR